MQLLVNVTYGLPIGVGLYYIGVPNAVLWGVLAAVLRFIPYLGPFLAALFPMLAFAVNPGWSMLLWVIGLFLFMELLSNNVCRTVALWLQHRAVVSRHYFRCNLLGIPLGPDPLR
jgi:predicted PurR-regulated permease PerM